MFDVNVNNIRREKSVVVIVYCFRLLKFLSRELNLTEDDQLT